MNLIRNALQKLINSPYLLLIFAPLVWSGNIVLARGINQLIPPVSLAFWRWVVALVILTPFTWRKVLNDLPIIKKHWKILAILSFLGVTCFNTMLYKAVQTTTAINGALIQTSMPAWIVLFSLLFMKEKVSLLQSIGVIVCILGALNIIIQGNWMSIARLSIVEGDIWMTVAVTFYALYSALFKKRPNLNDLSLLTITFLMGSIMLLPAYLWELSVTDPFSLTWEVGSSIFYVALFPSILAYLCWNRGIALIGANRTGLFINFIPVFASVLAILLLDESLHLFHFVGVTLIIGGMMLFNRKRAKQS